MVVKCSLNTTQFLQNPYISYSFILIFTRFFSNFRDQKLFNVELEMHLLTYCKLMARISLVSKPATRKWHAYKTATSLCSEHLICLFWQVFPLHTCVPRTHSEFKTQTYAQSCPALAELGTPGNRVHTLHCSHQVGSKIRNGRKAYAQFNLVSSSEAGSILQKQSTCL